MKEIKNVIKSLENEIETERKLYYADFSNINENIANWTKGYIKGITKAIDKLKLLDLSLEETQENDS